MTWGLTVLVTLTFAGPTPDYETVARRVVYYVRRVRERIGRFPYPWTVERNPSNPQKMHVHLAVSAEVWNQHWETITGLWSSGEVDYRFDVDTTRSQFEQSRQVADYLMKNPVPAPSGHRYHRAHGFPVRGYVIECSSLAEAHDIAESIFLAAPCYESQPIIDGWPTHVLRFEEPAQGDPAQWRERGIRQRITRTGRRRRTR